MRRVKWEVLGVAGGETEEWGPLVKEMGLFRANGEYEQIGIAGQIRISRTEQGEPGQRTSSVDYGRASNPFF